NIEEAQASTKQTGTLADAMANILAIKSHGREEFELKKYAETSEIWRSKSLASMRQFLKVSSVYASLTALLNTGVIVAAVLAVEHTSILIPAVYLSISYTFTVARQLWEMNNIMRNYNRVMGDANDMTEILDILPEIQDKEDTENVTF